MVFNILVVDCLTSGDGQRIFTRDFIGAGPRYVAGFITNIAKPHFHTRLIRSEEIITSKSNDWLKDYPVLAISAMTMDLHSINKIISIWKNARPANKCGVSILGGPVTADPNILHHIPIELAFIGEAESALHALFQVHQTDLISILNAHNDNSIEIHELKRSLYEKLPGIIYLENNKIIKTQMQASPNLNWFIDGSGFPEKITSYKDFQESRIYVECVRGCSNFNRTGLNLAHKKKCQAMHESLQGTKCNSCRGENPLYLEKCPALVPPGCGFCSTINEFGHVKSRNITAIVKEIEILVKMGARRIVLGGPDFLDFHREALQQQPLINPNFPEPNYEAIESLIEKLLAIPEIKKHEVQLFIENVKPSLCTDHVLDLLSKIPSAIFSIGCETGSNEFARLLGRPSTPNITYDAVQRAQQRGIRVHVYFIHSLPGDQAIYLEDTLNLMQSLAELQVEKITLYKYQELPGSPFYQMPLPPVDNPKLTHKLTEKLKRFVIQYNEQQKRNMLGKTYSVMVSEPNSRVPSDAIGWILEGGAKITIKNGKKVLGTIQKVKIVHIISDRLVEGELL